MNSISVIGKSFNALSNITIIRFYTTDQLHYYSQYHVAGIFFNLPFDQTNITNTFGNVKYILNT